jgi:AcrR family transcriptional regulator
MTTAMNRRLTQRGRERRNQLLDIAAVLFAERGYHPTSVAEIVEAASVGKGVFYWYFESKEALFNEILRNSNFSLRRRQQAYIGTEPDPIRRLELGVQASMHWYREHRHVFNLFQFAATETAFAATLHESQENALNDAVRHVKEAMAAGRIREGDPLFLTQAVTGVTSLMARRFIFERDDDPDEVAAMTSSFILHGLMVQE